MLSRPEICTCLAMPLMVYPNTCSLQSFREAQAVKADSYQGPKICFADPELSVATFHAAYACKQRHPQGRTLRPLMWLLRLYQRRGPRPIYAPHLRYYPVLGWGLAESKGSKHLYWSRFASQMYRHYIKCHDSCKHRTYKGDNVRVNDIIEEEPIHVTILDVRH